MTLNYINDNILYDVILNKDVVYTGTFDESVKYFNEHAYEYNEEATMKISTKQIKNELKDFVEAYIKATEQDNDLTIEQFYNTYNQ